MTDETESQRSEPKDDDEKMKQAQDPQWAEEGNKDQQMQKKGDEGQQNYREGLIKSPLKRKLDADFTKMGTPKDIKQKQPEASGKKREQEKETLKPELQSQPKKRQRTIFDYAGMRGKDCQGTVHQQKERSIPEEVIENNQLDSDPMQNKMRTEQQSGLTTLSSSAEEGLQCQDSGIPDGKKVSNQ